MIFLRLLPVIFTTLLFALHFSRAGNNFLAIIILLLLITLFIRNDMVQKAWQVFLGITGIVWIYIAIGYIQLRLVTDTPWMRLGFIMGGIVLFSFFSAWWMSLPKIKSFYGNSEESE